MDEGIVPSEFAYGINGFGASRRRGSVMDFLVFLLIVIPLGTALGYLLDANSRRTREEERRQRAYSTEGMRNRNNSRLTMTDCYVYLIRRKYEHSLGTKVYLKVGIGVEERVKEQLKAPHTELVSLYIFRNRWDAVNVEQKILGSWNKAFSKTSTLDYGSPGTEYILWESKKESQALEILKESGGKESKSTSSKENTVSTNPKSNIKVQQEVVANALNPTDPKEVNELSRTQVYLLENKSEKLLKIGMGKFSRPDQFKMTGWKVVRFAHFIDRSMARQAEKAVLNHWRNELNQSAPPRAEKVMKSGHTETVNSSVGIESAWKIVKESSGFIPALTQDELKIYDDYLDFFDRALQFWREEEHYRSLHHLYSLHDKHFNLSREASSLRYNSPYTKERTKEIMKVVGKIADDARKYYWLHLQTLSRVEKMKHWM
jgi:hypothetical protein